jgi:phosphatidylglycerophosphatase B
VLLLLVVVWFFPVDFIVTGDHPLWTTAAYWLTQSAGRYGTLILILAAGYCYSIRYSSVTDKLYSFFRSVAALIVFLSLFAFLNEKVIKPIASAVRPSHRYILTETERLQLLDSVYALNAEDRRSFFSGLITNNPDAFSKIDAKVLGHWIEESGYSFPSGHSFNAFMLATIFAFSIYKAGREQYHKYYFIPFVWAVFAAMSRVMIGAHTQLDVSVGAIMGLSIAMVFLYFDTTRKWIINRKSITE